MFMPAPYDDYKVILLMHRSIGNAYVTGPTQSSDFPVTAGAEDTTHNGATDVFLTQLNATGTALAYSTFLGSSGGDFGTGIALDASGGVYVTGFTDNGFSPRHISPPHLGLSIRATMAAGTPSW